MTMVVKQLRIVLLYVVIGWCIPINIGASAETSILGDPVDHLPEENGFQFVDVSAISSGKGVWVLTKVLQGSQIFQTHTLELWRLDVDGKTELKLDLRPYVEKDAFQSVESAAIVSRQDGGVIIAIPAGMEIFEYGFSFDGNLDYESVFERPASSGHLKSIEILSPNKYLLVFMDSIIFRDSEKEKTTIWEPNRQYAILDSLVDRDGQVTLLLIDPTKTTLPLVLAKFDINKKELSSQFEMNVWTGPIFGIKLIRDVNKGSAIVMAGKKDTSQFQIARFDSGLQLMDVLVVDKIPFDELYRYDALVLEQNLILFVTQRPAKSSPKKDLWLGLFSSSGELLHEEVSSSAFNLEVVSRSKLVRSKDFQSITLVSSIAGTNDSVKEIPQLFLRSHSFEVDDVLSKLKSSR